jgi:hypothetical protein
METKNKVRIMLAAFVILSLAITVMAGIPRCGGSWHPC